MSSVCDDEDVHARHEQDSDDNDNDNNNTNQDNSQTLDEFLQDGDLFDQEFDPDAEDGGEYHRATRAAERQKRQRQAAGEGERVPKPRGKKSSKHKAAAEALMNENGQTQPGTTVKKPSSMGNILSSLTAASARREPQHSVDDVEAFVAPAEVDDDDDRLQQLLRGDNVPVALDFAEDDDDMDLNAILFGKNVPRPIEVGGEQDEQNEAPAAPVVIPSLPQQQSTTTPARAVVKSEDDIATTGPAERTDRNFARTVTAQKSADSQKANADAFTSQSAAPATVVKSEHSPQPSVKLEDGAKAGENYIDMFWVDARELPSSPGSVFLFGKMATKEGFKSCCVIVDGIERCVMIRPVDAENVDMAAVVQEVSMLCKQQGIEQRRFKQVSRYYAFEHPNVPYEKSWWVKLRYAAKYPALRTNPDGHKTFTAAFGANRSFLEQLLIKRKVMGPCWIRVTNPTPTMPHAKVTWCKNEFSTVGHKNITVLSEHGYSTPPLVVSSINLVTHLNDKRKVNEIVAANVVTMRNVDMDGATSPEAAKGLASFVRKIDERYVFPYDMDQYFASKNIPPPRRVDSERILLDQLLEHIATEDPDVIVGHNFLSFHLDVLLHRLSAHHVGHWSRIGRLKLQTMPRLQSGAGGLTESSYAEREVLAGRMCCDTYLIAKDYVKASNYSLASLAAQLRLQGVSGQTEETTLESEEETVSVQDQFKSKEKLFSMMFECIQKSVFSLGIAFNLDILPLTKSMTTLAGNVWSRTLAGGRAERIEYLLLHSFHNLKYVTPDKKSYNDAKEAMRAEEEMMNDNNDTNNNTTSAQGKKKPKYAGGMVLEPKRGLYTDYVLLLDFNSLYPSIIQEFHICFTTVSRPRGGSDSNTASTPVSLPNGEQLVCMECASEGQQTCRHRNVLPRVIHSLVQSRRHVKNLLKSMKDPAKRTQLEIRQKALKLTANSMYGCLGFKFSRFYAQPLAELVTQQGRDALQSAVAQVPLVDPRLEVIYGDTDSVMINTGVASNLAEVRGVANRIKDSVNKAYRNLEIDIDGVFRTMLLVRKKKYAALKINDFMGEGVEFQREVKGLDIVRREWCRLSKDVSAFTLDAILTPGNRNEDVVEKVTDYLKAMHQRVVDGQVPLEHYIITKSLSKDPEGYQSAQDHPHVVVALRLKASMQAVQAGDIIPYVICTAESAEVQPNQSKLSYRAFHPKEVLAQGSKLAVDTRWYLENQVYGPISRLLDHVQGCPMDMIADILGLDKKIAHAVNSNNREGGNGTSDRNWSFVARSNDVGPDVRYESAKHLIVPCLRPTCGKDIDVLPYDFYASIAVEWARRCHIGISPGEHRVTHPWLRCPECQYDVPWKLVLNRLYGACRDAQAAYYTHRDGLSLHASTDGDVTSAERRLRQQLSYYSELFDEACIHRAVKGRVLPHLQREDIHSYDALARNVSSFVEMEGVLATPSNIAESLAKAVVASTRGLIVHSRYSTQGGATKEVVAYGKKREIVEQARKQMQLPSMEDILFELREVATQFRNNAPGERLALADLFAGMGK